MPAVEGIACSTATVVSNCDAQAELVPDVDLQFNPDDHERLAGIVSRLLRDDRWRAQVVERQRDVPGQFTEEQVARKFWSHLAGAIDARWKRPASVWHRVSRPRVAVITPLPPERSGVADYSEVTLPGLTRYVDVDVYSDSPTPCQWEGVKRVDRITVAPYLLGEYDRIINVVGNSHFHAKMVDLIVSFGGTCIAHDSRMADFYHWRDGLQSLVARASRELRREITAAQMQDWLVNQSRLETLFYQELVLHSQPFIVHSKGTQSAIRALYGREVNYLPYSMYLAYPEEELTERASLKARERLGLDPGAIVLSTFGHVHYTKAADECVRALESLHSWGFPAHLYFVGLTTDLPGEPQKLTDRLGLTPFVHLLDRWVSYEEYRQFMIASTAVIQLRTFGFGGLSGALMNAIGAGVPCVANEDLAASMDAPSYVKRIPDAISPILLAEAVLDILKAHESRASRRALRDAFVEDRSPERYASRLATLLGLL